MFKENRDDLILLFGSGATHLHTRLLLHGAQVLFGALVRRFFVHPQDKTVERHARKRSKVAPAERRPGRKRRREQVGQRNDNRVGVTLLFLHVQEAFGARTPGLVDDDESPRRELVLVADAGHQARHLIGAAAGTRGNYKLDGLGRLPSDCQRLSE